MSNGKSAIVFGALSVSLMYFAEGSGFTMWMSGLNAGGALLSAAHWVDERRTRKAMQDLGVAP